MSKTKFSTDIKYRLEYLSYSILVVLSAFYSATEVQLFPILDSINCLCMAFSAYYSFFSRSQMGSINTNNILSSQEKSLEKIKSGEIPNCFMPGLFTGLAGYGYRLLQAYAPQSFSNIFSFNPTTH